MYPFGAESRCEYSQRFSNGGKEGIMKENLRVVLEVSEECISKEEVKRMIGQQEDFLGRFLSYEKICIQCHDNPDADALASGYALYQYYKKQGRKVRLIYSGRNQITKPNLLMMVEALDIPVEYVTELPECDLLFMTDCQYGEGNVTKFEAPNVAMVDHHQCGLLQTENTYIRGNLGSCATVVWSLFQKVGFDISDDGKLSTALYYGLYTDTNHFEEIFHPLDKDMRDTLVKDEALLFRLINTNLSMQELNIASQALNQKVYDEKYRFAVLPSEPCDPNILGIISDFVIQVQEVDVCVAYNPNPAGFKLSVRSCIKEVKANELAAALCDKIGNGGGHLTKAGGFIAKNSFEQLYDGREILEVLQERMRQYFDSYEIIYAKEYLLDRSKLKPYQKKEIPVGVARATDFLKEGTPIMVRTLEGDVDLFVEDDLYFMIGIEGEVYPIRQEKYQKSYRSTDKTPEFMMDYAPTVRNNMDGEIYQLLQYMKPCVATGQVKIFAKPLEKNVKVFTAWDENKYYSGKIGDYIVCREDDPHDIYVVRGDIFQKTYQEIE